MHPLLCGLAANPALPSELVDRLISLADEDIALDLTRRTDLSRAQAVALAERVGESAVRLAYEGKLSAADIDPAVWPDAALALLDRGAGSPDWARLLASEPGPERREKLAACPGLPSDVVDTLAADPEVGVVAELALWTTPEVAARLAAHPHAEVRRAVAGNEATPPAVLAALVTGAGLPAALRCLVCDREETSFVHESQCARIGCDLPPGASCDGSHESTVHDMRQAALRNPATPVEVVVGFADHPSMLLRWALATRQDLPPQVSARLASDPAPGIRAELAENPALDDALIRALADDHDPDVRRTIAHHPRVPLDVLTALARTAGTGATLVPRIAACSPPRPKNWPSHRTRPRGCWWPSDATCRPRCATGWPATPTRRWSRPSPRTPGSPKRSCVPWSTGTASMSWPRWRPTRMLPQRCWSTWSATSRRCGRCSVRLRAIAGRRPRPCSSV